MEPERGRSPPGREAEGAGHGKEAEEQMGTGCLVFRALAQPWGTTVSLTVPPSRSLPSEWSGEEHRLKPDSLGSQLSQLPHL